MNNQNANIKKQLSKNTKIILISAVATIMVAVIVVLLVFCLTPVGTNNRSKINVVDALQTDNSITIPVKMKNGYYSPTSQTFSSKLSTAELCKLASEYDSSVKYELNGDKAYLYKTNGDKITARIALFKHQSIGKNLNYTANNMDIEGVIFPMHLTEKQVNEKIKLNGIEYNWYAVSFMTIDTLTDWLNKIGIYSVEINAQNDTLVCSRKVGDKQIKTQIHFNGNIVAVKSL